MGALTVITILVTIFEIWWIVAHLAAYRQTNEPLILVQVLQGLALAALFGYVSFALLSGTQVNALINGLLLLVGVVASIVWRVRGGPQATYQHYPRGLLDLLAFRRPVVDLKRRVRSK